MTIATQGMGTGLLAGVGITATGPMAAAINAGFSTLASRAAVSVINNKGDLSKVFKELGSNAFLKSLATSMLTAGLTQGLTEAGVIPVAPNPGTNLSFPQMLQANIIRNAIGAAVGTAIQGGDLGDSLSDALIQAAVQSVGAQGAVAIGTLAANGQIDKALQLVAHAALGCAIGTATTGTGDGGKGCVGGAVGGVVGELTAEAWLNERLAAGDIDAVAARTAGIDLARLSGGLGALLVGGDVRTGIFSGGNAAEFNALSRLAVSVVKFAGKLLKTSIQKGKLTAKDLKDSGLSELYDLVESGQTLVDADASLLEKAIALIAIGSGIDVAWLKAAASKLGWAKKLDCSFAPETLVLMGDGSRRPISSLNPGELVASRNEFTGRQSIKPIRYAYSSWHDDRVFLTLETNRGLIDSISTTVEHPFFVVGKGFVPAAELKLGDRVVSRAKRSSILALAALGDETQPSEVLVSSVEVHWSGAGHRAWNLTIDEDHTFYVGSSDAWVHNTCPLRNVNGVNIHGKGQKTGGVDHCSSCENYADDLAKSGNVTEVHINREWRSALGLSDEIRTAPINFRPDVLAKRSDGTWVAYEKASPTDDIAALAARNSDAVDYLRRLGYKVEYGGLIK